MQEHEEEEVEHEEEEEVEHEEEEEEEHEEEEAPQCCVCMEELDTHDAQNPTTRLPCGHVLHTSCAMTWFRSGHAECPLCRAGPPEVFNFPTVGERCWRLRQLSRRKGAPKELKTLVRRLRKAESEMEGRNRELREACRTPEYVRMRREVGRKRELAYRARRRALHSKLRLSLHASPYTDAHVLPLSRVDTSEITRGRRHARY